MEYLVTKAWRVGDEVMAELVGPGEHRMLAAVGNRQFDSMTVLSDEAMDQLAAGSIGKAVDVKPPRTVDRR